MIDLQNACTIHRDMELLEGVVASVGAQGPLDVSPVEICVFNILKTEAQRYRYQV